MAISLKNSTEAKEFMATIEGLLYIVDDIADKIPEGDYLNMMNHLKTMYGFKPTDGTTMSQMVAERVRQSPLVVQQERQARQNIKKLRDIKTDAEKLKNGWEICKLCDSIVSEVKKHQTTKKCRDGFCSKRLVKSTGKVDNHDLKQITVMLKASRISRQDI
tara:strand:- start:135 stop:617 length:483 start_codon:yes stop_codon:yes gene_type:complete